MRVRVSGVALLFALALAGRSASASAQGGANPGGAGPGTGAPPSRETLAEDAGLPAGSANLKVRALISPDTVTVGDPISIRYEVTADSTVRVLFDRLSPTLGDFEIKSANIVTASAGPLRTTTLDVHAVAYETGPRKAPPLEIPYRAPGGEGKLRADSLEIFVASVIPPGEKPAGVKPVKPPFEIGGKLDPVRVAIPLLALLAAAGLVYAWRHRRRPAPVVVAVPEVPPIPADIAAIQELERIAALGLVRAGRLKEHYSLVADCLRIYLRDRFEIDAPDRTTSEVLPLFERLRRGESEYDLLRRILEESDLVKFAKYLPPPEAPERVIGEAKRFVEVTRPASAPAAAPAQAQAPADASAAAA